jgi:hypothetical protein
MSTSLLKLLNEASCALHDPSGLHVGNFKWVGGHWKFKAVGYGLNGQVMPGHGPLTEWHNTRFDRLDEAIIRSQFFKD